MGRVLRHSHSFLSFPTARTIVVISIDRFCFYCHCSGRGRYCHPGVATVSVTIRKCARNLDSNLTFTSERAVDEPFFVFLVVIFLYFILEVLANSLVRVDYLLSMFFWFDILGAVSLIPDIPWLSESTRLALLCSLSLLLHLLLRLIARVQAKVLFLRLAERRAMTIP